MYTELELNKTDRYPILSASNTHLQKLKRNYKGAKFILSSSMWPKVKFEFVASNRDCMLLLYGSSTMYSAHVEN